MRFKKTPYCKRNRYKLYDDFGEEILEIKVGEYGVTEEDIRKFHAVDDHEVYINCKEMRVSPFETDIYQKWKIHLSKIMGIHRKKQGIFCHTDKQYLQTFSQIPNLRFNSQNTTLQLKMKAFCGFMKLLQQCLKNGRKYINWQCSMVLLTLKQQNC